MSDVPERQPPPNVLSNPQDDADRIRLKRLAKLQTTTSSPSSLTLPPVAAPSAAPKPIPKPSPKRPLVEDSIVQPAKIIPSKKSPPSAIFDLPKWESETVGRVFNVTLDRTQAEAHNWEIVWLKDLANDLAAENLNASQPTPSVEIADRLLIARLEMDPQGGMSDDPELLTIISCFPPELTVFEYLVQCWQRVNAARIALRKKGYVEASIARADAILDQLRDLVISYTGLTIQDPTMFPQPQTSKVLGGRELAIPLLALSSSTPLGSSGTTSLAPHEVEPFINDLGRRFEDDDLENTLGDVVMEIVNVIRNDAGGLAGTSVGTESWRAGVGALEALVPIKSIATMLTKLPAWNDVRATGPTFEHLTLLGPMARLGVFPREWPSIAETYFSNPERRTRDDVDASNATLRNTLHNLQQSVFTILNGIVRSGPQPREAVLDYFARALQLNLKRGGMHVDPATVASDGFMLNLQSALLRFAEPFLDANFSKLDRVDSLYYAHASRLDISEETRIMANANEAKAFHEAYKPTAPNFISDIFFLLSAYNHYGLVRTISSHDGLYKHVDDIHRRLEMVESDTSYQGTSLQSQMNTMIQRIKDQRSKLHSQIFAYQVQLLDSNLIDRTIAFTTFSMAWLIRIADPVNSSKYPATPLTLPLPREVPDVFKMLPEYLIEDVVEFYLFLVRHSQDSLELSGKKELLEFCLTFLSSTWFIKNPYLKAKLVQILFYGTLAYKRERTGVLGPLLNSHPLALQHLMPVLMNFYVEVENTGASGQFYEKFEARRNIAYIFKVVWDNPVHREALNIEAVKMEHFVRFANLLMNDATYLLDESLSKLAEIYSIQLEMRDQQAWAARDPAERKEREEHLRTIEGHATSYTALGKSTVTLLKEFTAEAKAPWMSPELVDRLAAMLNYNLDALAGPKCQDLKVENMEKYRFNPKQLLSDILQVYLNLSDQPEFIKAVAGEGRSYRKELFERAAGIARKRSLKTDDEIETLRLFVVQVEETKTMIEHEDDLGDVPDEFLDPILYTVMRDPVILPTSKITMDRSSIKAHLLSDAKDPFNRMPLSLEDVVPDHELKAKIDAFLIERRVPKLALNIPSEESAKVVRSMDVDP